MKCHPLKCSVHPQYVFAVWFHPPASSRRPIFMSRHALLSLAPPHRVTHDTTARLSPLIHMGSASASGRSPTNSSMTHAVATISTNSNRFIVMVQVSWKSFCDGTGLLAIGFSVEVCNQFFRQVVSPKIFLSTQHPPDASKLASDK